MNKDVVKDRQTTHAITNYLFAGYQGRFTFLNILSQLNYPNFDVQLIGLAREALDQIAKWTDDLWRGEDLFSASWTTAQTFGSTKALEMLDALRPDLYSVSNEVVRIFNGGPDYINQIDDLKFLVAAFGRFSYSREHYIQGFIQFGQKFNAPEEIERYAGLVQSAKEDIKLSHMLLKELQDPSRIDANFANALVERCVGLPVVFRTHAHDINQLLGNYRGGFSFENADFEAEEAKGWSEAGFNAIVAGYWRANNFTSSEAHEWVKQGVSIPGAAFQWRMFGFTAQRVKPWADEKFPPALAMQWLQAGYEASEAKEFIEKGIADPSKVDK